MSAISTPPNLNRKSPHRLSTWKRIIAWAAAILVILLVAGAIATVLLLRNPSFHRYILTVTERQLSSALNTQVQVRDWSLHLSGTSPTADLYDVVVNGAAPYPSPPLLRIDHLRIGAHIVSILRRQWYLQEVRVDHPVVHLLTNAGGSNNVPEMTGNQSSGNRTSVFDLGVRRALLDRGEIYYNDRKNALDANLRDLQFQAAFDPTRQTYSGRLGYRDGYLKFNQYAPLGHSLEASFDATPSTFSLRRALLTSGTSQALLTAVVQDYENPRIQATYEINLDSGDLRRELKNLALPMGVVHLSGTARYQFAPNRPLLDAVSLDGNLSSNDLLLHLQNLSGDVRDIRAHYTLDGGNAEVRELRADLLGGEVTGAVTMRNLTGASRSHLQAELHGISLADLRPMVNSPSLQQVAVGGTLNARTDAAWGKTLEDVVAKVDATIDASVAPAKAGVTNLGTSAATLPVNGVVHGHYVAATRQISLADSYLRTPESSLTLNGTVSDRSALQVHFQSNDLHELETVAKSFSAPEGKNMPPLDLHGTASLNGTVSGSTSSPQVAGQLTAQNLRLKGSSWRVLRSNVNLNSSHVSLEDGQLIAADGGQMTFTVAAGLNDWSFDQSSPVQVALNASNFSLAGLAKATSLQMPVTGILSANVTAHGSGLNPVGQGSVTLVKASVGGEPLQSLHLDFQGDGSQVRASLAAKMLAGSARGVVNYFPKRQGYEAQLQIPGLQLGELQALRARNLELTGVLSGSATGRGTFSDPGGQAELRIPQLKIRDQTISGLVLQANIANHVATVTLNSEVVNTQAYGHAAVHLTGGYEIDASLDTKSIPLQPLIAAYAPSQAAGITGTTEIHGSLRGPLKNKSLLEGHLTIPTLALDYEHKVQIGAAAPIRIDFVKGVLNIQRSTIQGTGTDLQFQGSIPTANGAPLSLLLFGTADLRIAQLFDPDVTSSGQLQFDINSFGAQKDLEVQGQVKIVNANFSSGNLPVGLQDGNGVLTLTKDRLNITRFTGTVGGGTVTASGGVVYRPAVQMNLALAARGIQTLYPKGMRDTVSANLALTGTAESALLSGLVTIDQLSLTPDFDLMNFVSQMSGGVSPPPSQGFSQNLQLNIGMRAENNLQVSNRTMSLEGNANLRLTGTAADPVVLGRVNLTSGDLIFRGNRYVLESGNLAFVNPSETQPVVNVAVETTIQQYNIHLRFQGPSDQLRTEFTSDPSLAPADIINLLAFGKTTEAQSATQTSTNFDAESAIASGVAGEVTNRLQKIAGISQLSVDPLLGCNQQTTGTCLTIQQRVTGSLFVTFATDVTSVQNQTVTGEYRITPRVSVSGTWDQNGGFAFDNKFRKTW